MSTLDWIVLGSTLLFIVMYGVLKTRGNTNIEGYLLGNKGMKWGTIGLSVMATQASAITFLSTPGQAYESGMAFVQNYFGLPIALVIISAVFIPIYYKLKVYTAYEYLETRFDSKTRFLGASLFLIQRGLAAGITIYAPAIILSTMLGWDLQLTIILVGMLVVFYTVSGGTKAVSLTQKHQMAVIMMGMFIAFFMIIQQLPEFMNFNDALKVAGKLGKMEAVDFSFDTSKRYTFWSGIGGSLFLMMSYFGTDQSQVQRYLSGKSIAESRMGLMFNAVLKVPMQFFILLVGVMLFVFYQFEEPPIYFKKNVVEAVHQSEYANEASALEKQYHEIFEEKKSSINNLVQVMDANQGQDEIEQAVQEVKAVHQESLEVREAYKAVLARNDAKFQAKDSDYVFLTFILNYLPHGLIGLLLAVVFSAAMSSTSSELNALASTTTVDFYKRAIKTDASEKHYLIASKLLTFGWGIIAISFALFAHLVENLIEAVNILGSIFYGTVLGVFLVAFFVKFVKGYAVFWAAILAQITVIICYNTADISYLWYNLIGCLLVIVLGSLIQILLPKEVK